MSHEHSSNNNCDELSQLRRQARLNELKLQIAEQHAALAALRRAGRRDRLEGWYDPGNFFDPRDYLFERAPLFGALPTTRNDRDEGRDWPVFRTEQDLALIRGAARLVVNNNPTALGILTALTNYVVGNGFQYAVAARRAGVAELAVKADTLIREFLDENDWSGDLDRELFQRSRVDGEYFLALWHMGGGHVQARAVEPDQVTEPSNKLGLEEWLGRRSGTPVPDNPGGNRSRGLSGTGVPDLQNATESIWTFGVHTDDVDAQEIHGYYVQWTNRDTEWNYFPGGNAPIIPPDGPGLWMLHARLNVVRSVKRGLSDFYPVQGNLDLARRVLRNMGEGSAVQAAIAWIQETAPGTTQAQTHTGTLSRADAQYYTRGAAGASRQHLVQQYDPATILKVPYGQKYLPGPLGGQHAPNFITSAEAILRTVALRWNLPEHLVTGTAENNNFASSLVAETPFVKYAESQQQFYAQRDRKTLWQVLKFGWQAGRLGNVPWSFVQRSLEITVTPPQIEVRDPEKETRVRQMLHAAGVLSRKTWSAQEGLDFEQEQKNLKREEPAESAPSQPMVQNPSRAARAGSSTDRASSVRGAAHSGESQAAGESRQDTSEANAASNSLEARWDPAKHPRGGYPQNRGWFSKASGGFLRPLRAILGKPKEARGVAWPPRVMRGRQSFPTAKAQTGIVKAVAFANPERDDAAPSEDSNSGQKKLSEGELLAYFKLLYGEKGAKILDAFLKSGGKLNIKGKWFANSALKGRDAYGPIRIEVHDTLNPAEAAQELMQRLIEASGYTEVRQHLDLSGFDNIELLKESYRQSIKHAAKAVALAAELYLSGISIVNEGADWVITIHDLSEGNYLAAIGLLPLVPAVFGKGGIVLKHGKETIRVPAEALQKIKALPVDDLIELLESTRKLARNMEKAGIKRPANAAAHHIVPAGLKKFKEAEQARAVLAKFGIGVENAANGVYLPSVFDDAVKAAYHGSVHTKAYYEELFRRLKAARSKEDALKILDGIRRDLLAGRFPT